MIFVDRSGVPNPLDPSTRAGQIAEKETAKIAAQIESGAFRQQRILFKAYAHRDVRDALTELFHGKCAYCESKIAGSNPIDIDQFRPKSGVTEEPKHPGYWWLANSWDNLLAACSDCNRLRQHDIEGERQQQRAGKGNRFPLRDEDTRVFGPESDIENETPLLLDPTRDDPEQHLVFDESGHVYSDTDRGHATIAVLGLNRSGLVKDRYATLRTFKVLEAQLLKNPQDDALATEIKHMSAPGAAFTAMIRQMLASTFAKLDQSSVKLANAPTPKKAKVSKKRVSRAKSSSQAYEAKMSDYTLDTEEGRRKFRSQKRFIERVTITNIRAIKSLELNFDEAISGPTPWLMLLGENGTGKSTVLQAIAIATSGHEQVANLLRSGNLNPDAMVRYRCKSGRITVKLSGFPKAHELIVHRDRLEFHSPHGETMTMHNNGNFAGEGWEAQNLVLGYGATRLLPRDKDQKPQERHFARADNLFDPFVPLIDATKWLADLSRAGFDRTAIVLKDLLSLEDGAELVRRKGKIFVRTTGSLTELRDLSDGYQAVVAVAIDILDVLSQIWSNLSEAEGIVLIDEIDAHLHPTWQMRIVGSMRDALPGVQFITTSHQPLCLRGLTAGEVAVMQKDDRGLVVPLLDLPSPEDLRIDQLLTSDFFGLHSTVDPDTEVLFDTYYALLAMPSRTPEQEAELATLKEKLRGRRQLGDTQREGLYFEAIDEILAQKTPGESKPPEEIREDAVQSISALWDKTISDLTGAT